MSLPCRLRRMRRCRSTARRSRELFAWVQTWPMDGPTKSQRKAKIPEAKPKRRFCPGVAGRGHGRPNGPAHEMRRDHVARCHASSLSSINRAALACPISPLW